MDHALLVGMLDRLADRHEEFQALARREPLLVAVLGDGNALDQLHDEERPARLGAAGVEHAGDVGVVHHRQGLPLGLEAGQHGLGVHARLDDFHGHDALHRFCLLGHEDRAHAPLADLLHQLVAADGRAGPLGEGRIDGGVEPRGSWCLQEAAGVVMGLQECFNPLPQSGSPAHAWSK